MASPGQSFMQTADMGVTPEEAIQQFVSAVAGMPGYSFNAAGSNSLVLTRRYTPTWAIVVAVIGILLFLLGLLALLVKNSETLTITATSTSSGSKVQINGVATPNLIARLNAVINAGRIVAE